MKINVTARLFLPECREKIVTAILTNEPPESQDHEPVLLVDGEPTQLKYEIVRA